MKREGGDTTSDLSMIIEGEVDEAVEEEGVKEAADGRGAGGMDKEEWVDGMRDLEIAYFAEVSTHTY